MGIAQAALQGKALAVLDTMQRTQKIYDDLNKTIKKHTGKDDSLLTMCDEKLESIIVAFLNDVLGHEIASYFLYECQAMKDGGKIETEKGEWPIKTIEDVFTFIAQNNLGE